MAGPQPGAPSSMNATGHHRLLDASPHHELHRSGTLCLGKSIAPLVFLLGCQRCGTNALHEDLMEHVKGAKRGHSLPREPDYYAREPHFFATDTWSLGIHRYLEHFPPCPPAKVANSELLFTVDATPAYLRKPIVATRLRSIYPNIALPNLKFVVVLRDPVKRLFAYWDAFVQSGKGVNDFDTWTDVLLGKVLACQKAHGTDLWPPPDEGHCDEDTIEGFAAGLFAYQLTYWFRQFSPSQFLLTSLDAYEKGKAQVLSDCAQFIGAPKGLVGSPKSLGTTDTQNLKVFGEVWFKAKRKLGEAYHPHNARLVHLLNTNQKVEFSPSLKGLGISGWESGS